MQTLSCIMQKWKPNALAKKDSGANLCLEDNVSTIRNALQDAASTIFVAGRFLEMHVLFILNVMLDLLVGTETIGLIIPIALPFYMSSKSAWTISIAGWN